MKVRQSFAWWSFTAKQRPDDPARFLRDAATAGAGGVEMLPPKWWPAARDAGLTLVTLTGHSIETGFNDSRNHASVGDTVRRAIELAASGGVHGVIVFSGNREPNIDDARGIANTVEGLAPLAPAAHSAGVVLLLELLNSRVDHPGYQCDRSDWGFEVVRRVGSPGLRALYDGYHMQTMEGNLSPTIAANIDLIGHVHTGGAPGRSDLDDDQDINWPGVAATLRRVGYAGWIGHEFIPKGEPIAALAQACALFSP
jgi:hydroxypyruvate isomerase